MIGSYESISQFENAIRGKNTLFYRPVNFIFVFISIILGDGSKKDIAFIFFSVLPPVNCERSRLGRPLCFSFFVTLRWE